MKLPEKMFLKQRRNSDKKFGGYFDKSLLYSMEKSVILVGLVNSVNQEPGSDKLEKHDAKILPLCASIPKE